jgi:lipopolysaccharide export LptBFGC system permease protein LptF
MEGLHVEDRLTSLEQAMVELREENRQLRQELAELRVQVQQSAAAPGTDTAAELAAASTATPHSARRWWSAKWPVVALFVFIVAVPVAFSSLGHLNAFWSTFIGTLNALFVYFIGPGAVRLLVEGLVRAIPGVALGQTTRIFVDKMRARRAR